MRLYVCALVCLYSKYADLESLKQIKFVRHVLAHCGVGFKGVGCGLMLTVGSG